MIQSWTLASPRWSDLMHHPLAPPFFCSPTRMLHSGLFRLLFFLIQLPSPDDPIMRAAASPSFPGMLLSKAWYASPRMILSRILPALCGCSCPGASSVHSGSLGTIPVQARSSTSLVPPAASEVVTRTTWPVGQMSVLPCHVRVFFKLCHHPGLFSVLLVGICLRQPIGNQHWTDPVPNLPNRLNRSGILMISA